jgi:hypothetical protein
MVETCQRADDRWAFSGFRATQGYDKDQYLPRDDACCRERTDDADALKHDRLPVW